MPALSLLGEMNVGTSYEFYACGLHMSSYATCSTVVGQVIVGVMLKNSCQDMQHISP